MNYIKEYTVTELVDNIKTILEQNFYFVQIIGEINDYKLSSSGHAYFNLKDKDSLINIVIFKNINVKFKIENGFKVKIFGRLTIYKDRSNYQIIVETIELVGDGFLLKILEERKNKLEKLGYFSQEHKKLIPINPAKVGIITSLTGAAIKDIESRLKNKILPEIIVYNSTMQGKEAENDIINGIKYFNKNFVDFIVITRGGGSLEDLMCFNSENIVMEIFNSTIPIISAVGHEIDWTLIDFVADLRLPTPTSVAEHIGISKDYLREKLNFLMDKIKNNINDRLRIKNSILNDLIKQLTYIQKEKEKHIIKQKYNYINEIFIKIVKQFIKNYQDNYFKIKFLAIKNSKFNIKKILKRGFAIIKKNNMTITGKYNFDIDEEIYIYFLNKKIKVKVIDFE